VSDITPEEEFIWVQHENPDILPAYVARSALGDQDGTGEGMANNGWSEMDSPPELDEDGRPIVGSATTTATTTTTSTPWQADPSAAANPEE